VNKKTGERVAVKIIDKYPKFEDSLLRRSLLEEDDSMALQNEVDILAALDHPNVVKQHEIYEEDDRIYLVLELMTGGEVSLFLLITPLAAFRQDCRERTLLGEGSRRDYQANC